MNRFFTHVKKKGIVTKIFIITTALLLITSLIIYFAIYIFLPGFYKEYKVSRLEMGLSDLVKEAEDSGLGEFFSLIDELEQEHNASVTIYTPDKKYGFYIPSKDLHYQGSFEQHVLEQFVSIEDDQDFILSVRQTLQPVDEAQRAILNFLPYLISINIIISVIAALFYAKMLSKPLLEVNSVAKKMAQLDFSTKSEYKSKDELGELSDSLNYMASSLQRTMRNLHDANEKLKEEIEHERKIEEERKDLFATISHELKSPITIVKGQLEGMIYNIGVYKDRDSYLKRAFESMEHLEGLVREILHLTKIDQVGFNTTISETNISESIENIVDSFHFYTSEKHLDVKFVSKEEIIIQTDKKLVEKALRNIIHNAMMYSPNGADIRITCIEEATTVHIHVFNSHVKIEEDQIDIIFEPFKRLEKSRNRNTGGSGLGLYLVKRIFEQLNIQYALTNEQDGVMFSIRIPKTE
ncbi:sensor histidine kinase [Bacillus solimangrovi]|uniref:histidine kinase n=1 Tax=Bacillus solimangrovi TaxID=1305675 RepID=A0A1E5LFL3_9BACI|nr:HAMP domain-containing sensor histidine kinase [Bacillus solimangrovi]OEH92853.1 hypothetical protein BFG57_01350 [Bacillus solimangrovi]